MGLSFPEGAKRRVTILGSTGSIGRNTIELIERDRSAFEVEALTAGSNYRQLAEQALRLRPALAVVADEGAYAGLRDALNGTGIEVAAGKQALVDAAKRPADWVMAAIVGAAGLEPTLTAIARGATVALANKECLVCAGELVTAAVRNNGAVLLPVDSEHNAIFQVFDFNRPESVDRIILTASGGPFRELTREEMRSVTREQALMHPNWEMGAKITIDSATMMNKGLELIEACHLFPVPEERVEILVHPQSVVHSLVAYRDGSVLAQLGAPDMRTPISLALAWPERMAVPDVRLDLASIGRLTFEPPDTERFPALALAREALQRGGSHPIVLNAANEVAVAAFLTGSARFLEIADIVGETLARVPHRPIEKIEDVIEVDIEARASASRLLRSTAAVG